MSDLADLYAALDSARSTMALSSQDWSVARDFAWLWGIFFGWDADPDDPDSNGAMERLAARFGWTDADVALLRRLHAAVAGFDIDRAAEAGAR